MSELTLPPIPRKVEQLARGPSPSPYFAGRALPYRRRIFHQDPQLSPDVLAECPVQRDVVTHRPDQFLGDGSKTIVVYDLAVLSLVSSPS